MTRKNRYFLTPSSPELFASFQGGTRPKEQTICSTLPVYRLNEKITKSISSPVRRMINHIHRWWKQNIFIDFYRADSSISFGKTNTCESKIKQGLIGFGCFTFFVIKVPANSPLGSSTVTGSYTSVNCALERLIGTLLTCCCCFVENSFVGCLNSSCQEYLDGRS